MRFGVVTPVLTRLPRAHAPWERDAGIDEVVEIAQAADRIDAVSHLTCSEHVAVPESVGAVRGVTYWDPLATFGYLAALTSRIRLATHVLVLGYHHPLAIAKRYGTLDRVCKGRLVLGVGVGSLEEEFELLGATFEGRGALADEALAHLRDSFGVERPPAWPSMVIDPCGVQSSIPIWVGGRTRRSLRRAVELADGWAPFGMSEDELRAAVASLDVPAGFDLVLQPERALDPLGDEPATVQTVAALGDVGATIVNVRLISRSLAHWIEQLEALVASTQSIGRSAPTS